MSTIGTGHATAEADSGRSTSQATRIFLRPIATPFPLGFGALATASLLVSGLELNWFAAKDQLDIAIVLIAFSFPLQLISSIFGFLGRDTAAATGFGVQGASWLVVGISLLFSSPGQTDPALGVMLLISGSWVAICAFGSAYGKLVPAAVLLAAALRFIATGIYEISAGAVAEHLAAIIGLVLVVLAGYSALAMEIENLRGRTVLPLLRRNRGREALEGDLAEQSRGLEHEAGAREQL